MRRYTREDLSGEEKLKLLRKFGHVTEVIGNTARITVAGETASDCRFLEISTISWCELKEAE